MIEVIVRLLKKGAVNLARAVVDALRDDLDRDLVAFFDALSSDVSAEDVLDFMRVTFADDFSVTTTLTGGEYPFKSE